MGDLELFNKNNRIMKEDRMDVEPRYPLFSTELESAEALASSQHNFRPSIWQTVM